jgi:hypothetical protein
LAPPFLALPTSLGKQSALVLAVVVRWLVEAVGRRLALEWDSELDFLEFPGCTFQ